MVGRNNPVVSFVIASLMLPMAVVTQEQEANAHYEIGVVYYADGPAFKPLDKETAPQGGRGNYSARVKGAHAAIRLRVDQSQVFRVCGVDPSRFELYRFKSERDSRTVTIAKVNMLFGGTKSVLSESQIPVKIEAAEGGCFTITPRKDLENGEFGFSPAGTMDAFMFGVGGARETK